MTRPAVAPSQNAEWPPSEIVHGMETLMPAPSYNHQQLALNFAFQLKSYLKNNPTGKVCISPIDVVLEPEKEVVQPDVLYHHHRSFNQFGKIEFVPELIVEIISPNSFERDSVEKKALYEQFGVQEYWLIEPYFQVIEIFSLVNGKYQLIEAVIRSGKVHSALLPGFTVDCEELFAELG